MVTFGLANNIEASKQHVREIAEAIGRDEAGEKLNADIDAALPNLPHSKAAISALIWQSDGFVAGEGTLQDDLLHRTGFHNMSRDYGLKNWDHLPLEKMLIKPPKIVFMPQSASGDDGRALYARRQVLRHLKGQTRIVSFPDQLLFCGGPTIIAAAHILNTARQAESGGQ
jgi:iron complex transport system substrate-binding protein